MHVVKCHSARAEATPKVAPVAAQNTLNCVRMRTQTCAPPSILTCSLYRPVARKVPVGGGSVPIHGCIEPLLPPTLGVRGYYPRKIF